MTAAPPHAMGKVVYLTHKRAQSWSPHIESKRGADSPETNARKTESCAHVKIMEWQSDTQVTGE